MPARTSGTMFAWCKLPRACGQRIVVGTAGDIANQMKRRFVNPVVRRQPSHPTASSSGGSNKFVEDVIPGLRKRDFFRRQYGGRILRGSLGLKRPASSCASTTARRAARQRKKVDTWICATTLS